MNNESNKTLPPHNIRAPWLLDKTLLGIAPSLTHRFKMLPNLLILLVRELLLEIQSMLLLSKVRYIHFQAIHKETNLFALLRLS